MRNLLSFGIYVLIKGRWSFVLYEKYSSVLLSYVFMESCVSIQHITRSNQNSSFRSKFQSGVGISDGAWLSRTANGIGELVEPRGRGRCGDMLSAYRTISWQTLLPSYECARRRFLFLRGRPRRGRHAATPVRGFQSARRRRRCRVTCRPGPVQGMLIIWRAWPGRSGPQLTRPFQDRRDPGRSQEVFSGTSSIIPGDGSGTAGRRGGGAAPDASRPFHCPSVPGRAGSGRVGLGGVARRGGDGSGGGGGRGAVVGWGTPGTAGWWRQREYFRLGVSGAYRGETSWSPTLD